MTLMLKRLNSPVALAAFGGLLMGLTPAPLSLWPLAWLALVPLWLGVQKLGAKLSEPGRSLSGKPGQRFTSPGWQALKLGAVWGLFYHGIALSWITGVHPMTWMGVPWLASLAIALFCWGFITFWGLAISAIWAWGMTVLTPKLGSVARILVGVALWCVLEAIWSHGPLWWTSLSYTQSPHDLVILQLGRLSGPLAITAAIVAVNGLLAEAWRQQQRRYALSALGLVAVLSLYGSLLLSRPLVEPVNATLRVGIIQGNIPNEIKLYPGGLRQALEGYTTGYETLVSQGVQAVLTPETAVPILWTDPGAREASSLEQAVQRLRVPIWVGGFGQVPGAPNHYTNSLFALDSQGQVVNRYDKVQLVPLGEYIPFESVLGGLIDRLSPLNAHLQAGRPGQIFDTVFGRMIMGICYESAYPQHFQAQARAGGTLILSAANNAHYSATMPAQHHAQDVMRAIETDRWTVRATNTGYSGIVDPYGRTRWRSGLRSYETHVDTVYRRTTQTAYVRWGDWLTPLLGLLALAAWTNKQFLPRR
ncbi:apolipoprotein N-acyltransferase [Leptolyngbya sp. FACHB-261]|uniref:apolipoprotein N-acyltransferase n=1 Tax=Leptolyngbya sp. FACHB-261 TaxID=2692806 RepID=UPI001685A30F|nr:apolipoprotein N-acyltransferase [Leptolyngbya sp. FACHB-261]MBD2100134.1 apolipoprotein N-acyltransferase [Leptolyngbya sp. FACHB-261]